jgi:hypothetical protein
MNNGAELGISKSGEKGLILKMGQPPSEIPDR